MQIDTTSFIVRNDELMSSVIDQEIVILNMAKNNYIGLDEIGRRIWELIETPLRVDELSRLLSREFEASAEEIVADVLSFLAELESGGLVHVKEG